MQREKLAYQNKNKVKQGSGMGGYLDREKWGPDVFVSSMRQFREPARWWEEQPLLRQ